MDIPVVAKLSKSKARNILIALSVVIVIFFMILFPWTDSYHQLGTSDWEEVPATISISEVREYTECGEDDCFEIQYPYISYSYSVDGELYDVDDIVLFDLDESDYGFSLSLVDEYPKGSELTAYYNSQDPNQAVLIKGFSGVLPSIILLFGMFMWVYAAVVTFLIVWNILFHIQPRENKKKAQQKYDDDEDDEREFREMVSKLSEANKTEAFQGESKKLAVQIDGKEGIIEVKTLMDIFESNLLDITDKGILYLEESHKMGRNLEFSYTNSQRDVLEIRELTGEILINEQSFNMDLNLMAAIDFILVALKSAAEDTGEWWN